METIYYRSNPGNAGDALIASGAYKLFDEAGLNYELINPINFDASGKTIIYAGGGNLVGIYPEARDFFTQHHKKAKQLVLLPHTVTKNEDLLAELGSNVTLFARELVSLEHLKKNCTNANVFLDHDLAFHLDVENILKQKEISIANAALAKFWFSLLNDNKARIAVPSPRLMLQNTCFEAFHNNSHNNFFREDVEAKNTTKHDKNSDLSKIYEYGTNNRQLTDYTTLRLLKFINRFDSINTDRLHICIAAALLGKKVIFSPNSYFKCRAVFEYSINGIFKNVDWRPSSHH